MSSFICGNNHYKKVKQLTYKLIKSDRYILMEFGMDYNSSDETIQNFVNNNIYQLYKLNVASVNLQYRDKQINRVYEDFDNNIGNDFILVGSSSMRKEDLIGLYNAYNCINYQIELDYNTKFIDIIKKHIASNLIRELTDNYNDQGIDVNGWEYE